MKGTRYSETLLEEKKKVMKWNPSSRLLHPLNKYYGVCLIRWVIFGKVKLRRISLTCCHFTNSYIIVCEL